MANFDPIAYAYITDKWLKFQGKPQIYGTQYTYLKQKSTNGRQRRKTLYKTKEFENINNLRLKMGFIETIEDYAQREEIFIPDSYYKKNIKR